LTKIANNNLANTYIVTYMYWLKILIIMRGKLMVNSLGKALEIVVGILLGIVYFFVFYYIVSKTNNLWIKVFKSSNTVDNLITTLYFTINTCILIYFLVKKKLRLFCVSFLASSSYSLFLLNYSINSLGPIF